MPNFDFVLILPREAQTLIKQGGRWGSLVGRISEPDQVAMVTHLSAEKNAVRPAGDNPGSHFLRACDPRGIGQWFRATTRLHAMWLEMRNRSAATSLDVLRGEIAHGAGIASPGGGVYLAVTYAPEWSDDQVPAFVGWQVQTDGVAPVYVEVEPDDSGLERLSGKWPIEVLRQKSIAVVGAGSIGSAVAHALAMYGIGTLHLVDPDRLLFHNLVRHTSAAKYVGKRKVEALALELEERWPDTKVNPHAVDIVRNANTLRELLTRSDLLLCATDGVASRRVASHLARRAKTDAVLACVLEDGALGEVIRLRPWADHGCITCIRESLMEQGAFDPEPGINRPYGAGTSHLPMTAVGSDLHLIGQFAAKMSVATLLQAAGFNEQKLPGEHLLIGLRPSPSWRQPYDVRRCGELKWLPKTLPRPGCPTCEEP